MNKDELTRVHLSTVLRMAVRLGRLSVPDHAMDTELRDLAQLYLDATGNPMAWDAVKVGQVHQVTPGDWLDTMAARETLPAQCGFLIVADDGHNHVCDKAPGHADGPGGSDHRCAVCGCLYDAAGGMASPLGMAGLPLGGNGPVEEQGAIEL